MVRLRNLRSVICNLRLNDLKGAVFEMFEHIHTDSTQTLICVSIGFL